jgi:hypothetical protein
VKKYNLEPVGVHFFREEWSEAVSKIYQEVLGASLPHLLFFPFTMMHSLKFQLCGQSGEKEPRYGKAPKIDRYTAFGRVRERQYDLL